MGNLNDLWDADVSIRFLKCVATNVDQMYIAVLKERNGVGWVSFSYSAPIDKNDTYMLWKGLYVNDTPPPCKELNDTDVRPDVLNFFYYYES